MRSLTGKAAPNSFAQILRSSSITGSASAINIVLGIARLKVAALLLGPTGVGQIGLLQNLIASGSAVAAVGIGTSGTRQIALASAAGDEAKLAASRRALLWTTLALVLLGTAVFWLLRKWIATVILEDSSLSSAVGWLSLGVAGAIGFTAQIAVLMGFRRIGDGARVNIVSAVVSSTAGIAVLVWLGERGIVPYVLLPSISGLVAAAFYVRRLPAGPAPRISAADIAAQSATMLRLGFAFMLGSVATLLGQLAVRVVIQHQLGLVELGKFQAGWAISMTYVAFVLQAMGADYFPRLTGAIDDHAAANLLVNEQTEVALLLSAPILLGMLATAPWALQLLYSSAFTDAAAMLRWQILGDLLKIASWPLGYLLLASGKGRIFAVTESLSMAVFVLFTWASLPAVGLQGAGLAFLAMYAFYLPLVYFIARRRSGFRWSGEVKRLFGLLIAAYGALCATLFVSNWAGLVLGLTFAAIAAAVAVHRLKHALGLGPLRKLKARERP